MSEDCRKDRIRSLKKKLRKVAYKNRLLRVETWAQSRKIKQLIRQNQRVRADVADLVYEVCPYCDVEQAVRWDAKRDGFLIHCPTCGQMIPLCSQCDLGIRNGGVCGFGYADDACYWEVNR